MEAFLDLFFGILIPVGIIAALLVYPPLQIAAIIKLRGIWRFLAILPLLPMAYVLIVTVIAFRQDLNLWPVLLIFAAPLALAYLIVVMTIYSSLKNRRLRR